MAILVNQKTRVIVQGLTGREGTFHAKASAAYGTQIVGGVTPGKGGTTHEGWPIAASGDLKKEPWRVAAAFLADYPLHAFSKTIKDVIDSQGLRDLKAVRNVVAHRGILPRRHFQVNAVHQRSAIPASPQELGVDFDYASNLDDELTRK